MKELLKHTTGHHLTSLKLLQSDDMKYENVTTNLRIKSYNSVKNDQI